MGFPNEHLLSTRGLAKIKTTKYNNYGYKSIKYIGFILLAFSLNACNEQRSSSSSETTTPVWLTEVGKRNIRELTTTTGTAKASKTAEIKSEITGKYELMNNPKTGRPYKLGDIVEAGAVIVKLNNKEHENSISLQTKKMQVDIARKEWDGQKVVYDKGGATEKDVLNAESSYIQAQTALETANTELEKINIRAPFKGVIVTLPYFTPGIDVASGEIIVGMMDYSQMYMEIALPENAIEKVKVGQKVLVTNYNIKSDTLSGTVSQLSPAINEETRTFSGYIAINNPELKLRPGMFAKGEIITLQRDSVLFIPKEIVNARRGMRNVFTVEQNRAVEKYIKTGISDDRYTEVTEGLNEGDKIVIKGYEFLRNRGKVKIMK